LKTFGFCCVSSYLSYTLDIALLEPESSTPPPGTPDRTDLLERFGAHGDLSTRFMNWGVKYCPPYLEPLFIFGYTAIFFLLCAPPRRAVTDNLCIILPDSWKLTNIFRAFRVFWNFAWTCADGARAQAEGDCFDWEIVGLDHFDSLVEHDGGAILMTAHMGSYDVAAPVFARKFKRKIHAVRAPERNATLQAHREQELQKTESDALAVRYNTGENLLAVDLVNALSRHEIVAIQGDRVIYGVTPLEAEMFGHQTWFPKGPFTLAMAGKAPIYPIFIIRLGRLRYQVRVEHPIECRREGRDASTGLAKAAGDWSGILGTLLQRQWHQWFVFEHAFDRNLWDGEP